MTGGRQCGGRAALRTPRGGGAIRRPFLVIIIVVVVVIYLFSALTLLGYDQQTGPVKNLHLLLRSPKIA